MELVINKIKRLFFSLFSLIKSGILVLAACPVAKRSLWFGAVFFFVFLGLIFPSQFAQAGFLDVLAAIPVSLINLILQLILITSNLALGLGGIILGWVVGPYFTTLPYTHGGIVDIGWPLVRDFINMFFIIALVIIGLSTALRIKEYQAQKALPVLIAIAILINFTPVICGLIIDAANILMNFFLEELTGFQLIRNFFGTQVSSLGQALHPRCFFDLSCAASALGKTTVMIAFGFVAGYIFFIYSLLFIMRYVMIWVLVIVSPIAFFSKIFKGSEKYLFKSILGWDEWWKQFIEWSLLGVIAGFFLYLAEQLMMLAPGMISGIPPGQGGGGWVGNPIVNFVNNFLPWMVVLVFLWIGYKIAKATSAMGAQGVIKAVDTGIKIAVTSAIAAATMGAGAAAGAGFIGKAAMGARRLEGFIGKAKIGKVPIGKGLKLGVKPLSWATRGVEMAAGRPLEKYAARVRKEDVGAAMKGTEGDIEGQITRVESATTDTQRIQRLAWMKKEGTLQNASQIWDRAASLVKKFADNPHFRKEASDVADAVPDKMIDEETKTKLEPTKKLQAEMKKEIVDKAKELSAEVEMKPIIDEEATRLLKAKIVKTTTEAQDLAARNIAAKYIHFTELKSGDMKDVAGDSIKSAIAGRALRDTTPQHLQAIVNNFKPKTSNEVIKKTFTEMFTDKTDEENREIFEKYYSSDPRHTRMIHWALTTPAGREMNLPFRNYMRDPNDQPTTNLDAFGRRMGIQKELAKEPLLEKFNESLNNSSQLQRKIKDYERRIEGLQKRGQSTTYWETRRDKTEIKLEKLLLHLAEIYDLKIEPNPDLYHKWGEIERLRRPGKKKGP